MGSENRYDLQTNKSRSILHLNVSDCKDLKNLTNQAVISKLCPSNVSSDEQQVEDIIMGTSTNFREPQILALLLSFIAITLNVLSLLAIAQIRNRMSTHLRLIVSLCLSDLLIALSLCLHVFNKEFNPYSRTGTCSTMILQCLNNTGLISSLLNLTMMAIDHFMAISRPLHYNLRMRDGRKISLIILLMWSLATLGGFADFFTGWNDYYIHMGLSYCSAVYMSLYNDEYIVFAMFGLTSILFLVIYSLIYKKIRDHQTPGEGSSSSQGIKRTSRERQRNKQALITTLLILGTFMFSWMPTCLYQVGLIIQVNINPKPLENITHILLVIDGYLYDLMLLNAIADPIIYAVRMYDVQLGYRRLFHFCRPVPKQGTDITLLPWARMGNAQSLSGSRRLKTDGSLKEKNIKVDEALSNNKLKFSLPDGTSPV